MTNALALEWLKAANDDLMLIASIIEKAELTIWLRFIHTNQSKNP